MSDDLGARMATVPPPHRFLTQRGRRLAVSVGGAVVALTALTALSGCGPAGTGGPALGSGAIGSGSGSAAPVTMAAGAAAPAGTSGSASPSAGSPGGGPDGTTSSAAPSPLPAAGTIVAVPGPAGCGLTSAAFCDTFDAPAPVSARGRAGELDAARWSGSHLAPTMSGSGGGMYIGPATVPSCRGDVPAKVLPDHDALVCDPNPAVASRHLMMAVAAQNYGQDSYRIRQPFDFAGRTGKVTFDTEAYSPDGLVGWTSVEVLEDPVNAPSFSTFKDAGNNEGTILPRNGIEVQLRNNCGGYATGDVISLSSVSVFRNHQETDLFPPTPTCVTTKRGHLNHVELRMSQHRIEVWATNASADGRRFAAPKRLFSTPVDLPFSRGYVSVTTHNHASLKYSKDRLGQLLDSWVARWDNVGFDGPVVRGLREVSVPDPLRFVSGARDRSGPAVDVGFRLADRAKRPAQTLHLPGVDPSGATSARLSLDAWFNSNGPLFGGGKPATYGLRYRLNGKAWHDRRLDAVEGALLTAKNQQGWLGLMLDVPVSDLMRGTNTLQIVSVNADQSYAPVCANVDLILAAP